MIAEGFLIGFNLFSAHLPANPDLSGLNPGVYVRVAEGSLEGLGAGVYRNSHHRTSWHVDYTLNLGHGFSLTGGLVSGYQQRKVNCVTAWVGTTVMTLGEVCATSDGSRYAITPFAAVSYSFPAIEGWQPVLAFLPNVGLKASSVLHFSIQRTFP